MLNIHIINENAKHHYNPLHVWLCNIPSSMDALLPRFCDGRASEQRPVRLSRVIRAMRTFIVVFSLFADVHSIDRRSRSARLNSRFSSLVGEGAIRWKWNTTSTPSFYWVQSRAMKRLSDHADACIYKQKWKGTRLNGAHLFRNISKSSS